MNMQETSKPTLTLPPSVDFDVSSIFQTTKSKITTTPFQSYCKLLATSIERKDTMIYDVGLVNQSVMHNNPANHHNWNRERKSVYIIAISLS